MSTTKQKQWSVAKDFPESWEVVSDDCGSCQAVAIKDSAGKVVAFAVDQKRMFGPLDTSHASLIAAAPQQHDALLAVLHAPGFNALDDATKNAVRAAIAKSQEGGGT